MKKFESACMWPEDVISFILSVIQVCKDNCCRLQSNQIIMRNSTYVGFVICKAGGREGVRAPGGKDGAGAACRDGEAEYSDR